MVSDIGVVYEKHFDDIIGRNEGCFGAIFCSVIGCFSDAQRTSAIESLSEMVECYKNPMSMVGIKQLLDNPAYQRRMPHTDEAKRVAEEIKALISAKILKKKL